MKKILAVALVLIVAATSLSALDFVVGPKVMLGDYSTHGDDSIFGADDALSLSFAGGAFVNLQLTSMIGIQPEVYFNYVSFREKSGGAWVQMSLPVVSIPVYARFDFDVANIGVYALAGARFDIRISDTGKAKTSSGGSGDMDISSMNSLFIGAAAGGGVSLPIGPGVLDTGLGIYYGFTELDDGIDAKPWDIDLQVAYGFSL